MAKKDNTDDTQGLATEDADSFTFDFSGDKESAGFEPMPKGTYDVVIEEVEFKISASSQNPMWSVKWAIETGEFAEKNRKLFSFVVFGGKDGWRGRVKSFLNRVAPELSDKQFSPKQIADDGILIGKRARAKVDVEKNEDYGPRNTVRDILAPAAVGAGGGFSL